VLGLNGGGAAAAVPPEYGHTSTSWRLLTTWPVAGGCGISGRKT